MTETLTKQRINTYEGFFLFPQSAATNLQGAVDHVKELLARIDAEIISFSKWDERRLAYEIRGNKRGIYFLAYFKAGADTIATMERAANLSEQLLRFMITRADLLTTEMIEGAEGSDKLADEIKLREEQAASGAVTEGAGTSKVHIREEQPEPAATAPKPEATDDAPAEAPAKAPAEAPAEAPADADGAKPPVEGDS